MTKQQMTRMYILEEYMREFLSGPKTLKELQGIQKHPANMINNLVEQGYIVKLSRGQYQWKSKIKSDNLLAVAKMISENWNHHNVYCKPTGKLIGDYSSRELLEALNAKGAKVAWDFTTNKLILL